MGDVLLIKSILEDDNIDYYTLRENFLTIRPLLEPIKIMVSCFSTNIGCANLEYMKYKITEILRNISNIAYIKNIVLHAKKRNETMKILLANKEKANPQIAQLPVPQAGLQLLTKCLFLMVFVNVAHFARAYAQTQNCKRAIFCQRT